MNSDISTNWVIVLLVIVIWDLVWKGKALWRAAQQEQTAWFVIILITNTLGVLPILYLYVIQKNANTDGEAPK